MEESKGWEKQQPPRKDDGVEVEEGEGASTARINGSELLNDSGIDLDPKYINDGLMNQAQVDTRLPYEEEPVFEIDALISSEETDCAVVAETILEIPNDTSDIVPILTNPDPFDVGLASICHDLNGPSTPTDAETSKSALKFAPSAEEPSEQWPNYMAAGDCDKWDSNGKHPWYGASTSSDNNFNFTGSTSKNGQEGKTSYGQSSLEASVSASKVPVRSSLKRRAVGDGEGGLMAKKAKKKLCFKDVSVYYFPRTQGFTCIPSQGGSTLGMSLSHSHAKTFSLNEYASEQRKARIRQSSGQTFQDSSVACLEGNRDSSEDSDSEELISDPELDYENFNFLQPISTKERRIILKSAGVERIDPSEKDECRNIRQSREFCGCSCQIYCDPDTCACSQAGIKCQVDRMSFPCSCTRDRCENVNGRVEFNPVRVRTHYIHTLMRLELEKKQERMSELTTEGSGYDENDTSRDPFADFYRNAFAAQTSTSFNYAATSNHYLHPSTDSEGGQASTSSVYDQPPDQKGANFLLNFLAESSRMSSFTCREVEEVEDMPENRLGNNTLVKANEGDDGSSISEEELLKTCSESGKIKTDTVESSDSVEEGKILVEEVDVEFPIGAESTESGIGSMDFGIEEGVGEFQECRVSEEILFTDDRQNVEEEEGENCWTSLETDGHNNSNQSLDDDMKGRYKLNGEIELHGEI